MADSEGSPFYAAALHERLSQGDIVKDVPWGLVDAPFTMCQPFDASLSKGKATYGPPAAFPNAFTGNPGSEDFHATGFYGTAMVLWHDCQIDKFMEQKRKPAKWFAAIAPIVSAKTSTDKEKGAIASGSRRAFFPLATSAQHGVEPDSYVDLRYVIPLKQDLLTTRVATLSRDAREALYAQLFTFLTQLRIADRAECPSCKTEIPVGKIFVPAGTEA